MVVKSLKLFVPDQAPYDEQETWFETFIGTHILQFVEHHKDQLGRFWFTRYGKVTGRKHLQFRFEVDDESVVSGDIQTLRQQFTGGDEYTDYNYLYDLGENDRSRLFGNNSRHSDKDARAELAFDFLHAAARLFLHCLSGPDSEGRFRLEEEVASTYNRNTSMEQYHHFFCNVTGIPAFLVYAIPPGQSTPMVLGFETWKSVSNKQIGWQWIQDLPIHY